MTDEASISSLESEVQESESKDVPGEEHVRRQGERRREPRDERIDEEHHPSRKKRPRKRRDESSDEEHYGEHRRSRNKRRPRSNESLKIGELNANVYIEICTELNKPKKGKDYKTLAGRLGYHIKDVNAFQLKGDPADALLSHWGTKSGNDVEKLIAILRTMERDGLVEILGGKKEVVEPFKKEIAEPTGSECGLLSHVSQNRHKMADL